MDLHVVGHLECGMEVHKGISESLRGLEVCGVLWQPVPVTYGPRIKRDVYASFMASHWHKHLVPLVHWSFRCTKS